MSTKPLSGKPVNGKPVNWTIMVYISADDVLANFAIDSLNQFRSAATDVGDKVVALFDPNDGDGKAFRYSFEIKKKDALLSDAGEKSEEEEIEEVPLSFFEEEEIDAPNMADPKTLTDFVNWATVDPNTGTLYKAKDRNYCLILWGHGTELLLDQDPGIKEERYLTPAKLKTALKSTELSKNNRLDIVAFDACSMSMIELASALQGCVRFMIASQDEVPDVSFPYGKILGKLQGHGKDPKEVCRLIPKIYLQSFRDYRITYRNGVSRNGAQEIMLSSLNLEKIENITVPVGKLANLMLRSIGDEDLSNAIVDARKSSRDFVLGLFVDLSDFCEKLFNRLEKNVFQDKDYSEKLKNACVEISNTIKITDAPEIPDTAESPHVMIANEKRENVKDCHGVSIYFPYSVQEDEDQQTKRLLGDNQTGILNLPLVKGGGHNTAKARNGRIVELEADFEQLPFFKNDGWGDFIKRGWSLVLARRFPDKLDLHYSAEKVAQNLSAALDDRSGGGSSGGGGGDNGPSDEIRRLQKQNEDLTKELERLALKPPA
jgi:hypothetical protein